jgi:pullulanase/glycogen debranching enzyme
MSEPRRGRRGATDLGDGGVEFVLWAPDCGDIHLEAVEVRADGLRQSGPVPTTRDADGNWVVRALRGDGPVLYDFTIRARVGSTGERYARVVSDPYARAVHRDFRSVLVEGPAHTFAPFVRPALRDLLIYELHVYNFTAEDPTVRGEVRGTYAGVIAKLPHLRSSGSTPSSSCPSSTTPTRGRSASAGTTSRPATSSPRTAATRPTKTARARSSSSSSTPATRRASR